ncbi:hypothetical protein FRX31_021363 [Thalictrum thalictroides]|uniref:DUF4283 domain-containing protein n=1 Tax=Thalictrum thalictroides TaxID=46969 RepID=A0A7J6VXZ5_THATH|nr:hypothetical protein FRX31_021363 [Thalictrum thalictroides]
MDRRGVGRGNERVCRFSKVEAKIFEYVWFKGGERSAEVMLNERSKRGYFEVFSSKEGVQWLGKLMCSWSVGRDSRTREKFEDELTTIMVHKRKNSKGEYAFCLFFNRRLGSRVKSISYPAGFDRGGWAEIGSRMVECLDPIRFRTQPAFREENEGRRGGYRELGTKVETGGSRRGWGTHFKAEKVGEQTSITILGEDTILNGKKWQKAGVLYKEEGERGWRELSEDINSKFPGAECHELEEGTLLVFFKEEEEVKHVLRRGGMELRGVMVKAQKWRSELNSLESVMEAKERWIWLRGIPLHLKTKEVINQIGSMVGEISEVDTRTIGVEHSGLRIKIKDFDITKSPKCVTVIDKRYKFVVVVIPMYNTTILRSWDKVVIQKMIGDCREEADGRSKGRKTGAERTLYKGEGEVLTHGQEREEEKVRSIEEVPPGFEKAFHSKKGESQITEPDIDDRETDRPAKSGEEVGEFAGQRASSEKGSEQIKTNQWRIEKGEDNNQRVSTMNQDEEPLQNEGDEQDHDNGSDAGSDTGPSMVKATKEDEAQDSIEDDSLNGSKTSSEKGTTRGRNRSKEISGDEKKKRARSMSIRRGGLGIATTLVLSKRKEWEARRKAEINKRKSGKRREEGSSSNQINQMDEEEQSHEQRKQRGKNLQITARVVEVPLLSDETPQIEFESEERGETERRDLIQKRKSSEVLRSLARCETEEDVDNWWRLIVVPTASKMGLSHQLGFDALKILLKKLCKQKVTGSGNNTQQGAMQELGRLLEGGVSVVNYVG